MLLPVTKAAAHPKTKCFPKDSHLDHLEVSVRPSTPARPDVTQQMPDRRSGITFNCISRSRLLREKFSHWPTTSKMLRYKDTPSGSYSLGKLAAKSERTPGRESTSQPEAEKLPGDSRCRVPR